MNKEEYIKYWVATAEDDWKSVEALYQAAQYVNSLFFAHLVLEKLAKALWVKNMAENNPPRIHNIVYLLEQADITLTDDQKLFLIKLNDFQLEGRYPDYLGKIYQAYNKERTFEVLETVKEYKSWLHNKLS